MKKRHFNLPVILVIATVFSAAFSGCDKKEEDSTLDELYAAVSEYEEALESLEAEESANDEIKNKQNFVVVIPARCGAELLDGANFLSDELSKYVGYDVEAVYDSDYKKSSRDVAILVGETNRAESIHYIRELRADDYGYEWREDTLYIGARTEELCVEAINAFVEALEEEKIDIFRVSKIEPYFVEGEYEIDEIRLCGFEIYEYDIVYPEANSMHERELANILRDRIAEYSGYTLRVISDRQVTDATRAICVGKSSVTEGDCADNETVISVSADENIELISGKNAGIYCAIENFLDLVRQSESNGVCNVELVGTKTYSYDGNELSFYIIKDTLTDGSIETISNLKSVVGGCSLSVFDNVSEDIQRVFESNFSTISHVGGNSFCYVDGVNIRCIYEKSEILSDGGEVLTLVMERADGKKFAFVGGFCDEGADGEELLLRLNEECKNYADANIPLVVAHELGDSFDRSFRDANIALCAVSGFSGLYFSEDALMLTSASTSEMGDGVSAELVKFDFYYT